MKNSLTLFSYLIAGIGAIYTSAVFPENAGVFNPPNLQEEAYTDNNVNPFAESSQGQCTWYVYGRVKEVQQIDLIFTDNQGRDAFKWNELLISDYPRLSEPKLGAIAIWKHKTKSDFGHVAYIEHVYGDVIIYTEANFSVPGNYDGKLKHENRKTFEGNKGSNNGWDFIGYVLPTSSQNTKNKIQQASSGEFEGVWKGTGIQVNNRSWTIKITIIRNQYTIEYPSLSCGGNLTLLSSSPEKMEFKEQLSYGKSKCIDNGNTVIVMTDSNIAQFEWYYPNGKQGATGTLVRD